MKNDGGGAGVKMAKKMKINGRKLKDRVGGGGDDLTVIFPARLPTSGKNLRGDDAAFFSVPPPPFFVFGGLPLL